MVFEVRGGFLSHTTVSLIIFTMVSLLLVYDIRFWNVVEP